MDTIEPGPSHRLVGRVCGKQQVIPLPVLIPVKIHSDRTYTISDDDASGKNPGYALRFFLKLSYVKKSMPDSVQTTKTRSLGIRWRSILLALVVVFVIVEIVALSPSTLEKPPTSTGVAPEAFIPATDAILAGGIPKKVPDYSIDGFQYVSSKGVQKQWKLVSNKAYLYNAEKIVHARTVVAYLFDSSDKITVVTGKEAKYFMNGRDLEIFGDVVTKFPDGFETRSEYLRYLPAKRKIEIPVTYPVNGSGSESPQQAIEFKSHGMDYDMGKSLIYLPQAVRFVLINKQGPNINKHSERTVIESDHCRIDRVKQIGNFTMNQRRPLKERFVRINQVGMYGQGREVDIHYGDFSKLLQYMVARGDVLLKETGKESLQYATGGRADFDAKDDLVVLTEFPQVYQDNDTVTGDIIKMHRDTDIVEVENSNAFSEGE